MFAHTCIYVWVCAHVSKYAYVVCAGLCTNVYEYEQYMPLCVCVWAMHKSLTDVMHIFIDLYVYTVEMGVFMYILPDWTSSGSDWWDYSPAVPHPPICLV